MSPVRSIVISEGMRDGINTFAGLARKRVPVAILDETTRGRLERSSRYCDAIAPSSIPFEMRATFVARGRAWGAVHLARRDDKHDCTPAGAVADGIRGPLRFDAARRPHGADGPRPDRPRGTGRSS